jgi:molecular chaperone GrpE
LTEKAQKKNIPIETKDDHLMQSEDKASDLNDQKTPKEADALPEENEVEASGEDELSDNLETLKQNVEKERDRFLRLSAEFENYKKRMTRQMDDFRKYANESLLKDLLTVVDNLERAIQTSEKEVTESTQVCVVEGVEMTLTEVLKILKKGHVTPVEAMGKAFDPAFHEAVMQEESEEHPENTVINEFQKGYLIHDRLLRPAMVVVSKEKS